jgi:hypothetical protein
MKNCYAPSGVFLPAGKSLKEGGWCRHCGCGGRGRCQSVGKKQEIKTGPFGLRHLKRYHPLPPVWNQHNQLPTSQELAASSGKPDKKGSNPALDAGITGCWFAPSGPPIGGGGAFLIPSRFPLCRHNPPHYRAPRGSYTKELSMWLRGLFSCHR